MIRPVVWKDGAVILLDQTKLPLKEKYVICKSVEQVARAIETMIVRGAPAIGVTAAMGVALSAYRNQSKKSKEFRRQVYKDIKRLSKTRPTAVNLFWALERMKKLIDSNAQNEDTYGLVKKIINEAIDICNEDIEINRKMGQFGEKLFKSGDTVLTHCNAGALATAGYGTALGVIRAAVERGKKINVIADETRPFLQGARLTAWELKKDRIPVTLITDNMAGYLFSQGLIDRVIVGADRIAANGDVANKIGTYNVALLAYHHKVPFYVAAPLSTIDRKIKNGSEIPIEERKFEEVTKIQGKQIAPKGVKAKNPAFDVTPSKYVSAIITEKGVLRKPYRRSIKSAFEK
ncbi:MAG: S-methyl-5-thioribose-1-phosphate isomerase [Candidatus Schekmanbacteria bacterium]|nr:MAG: S-methyl-5-thioribose-1-phosphate isomerase [Candidatus Schekmanbacteria bacterium]